MGALENERREIYERWDIEALIRKDMGLAEGAEIEWRDDKSCVVIWQPEHILPETDC